MKMVVIGPTWPYKGGIVHYNTWLCNFMKRRGHEVYSFSFKKLFPKLLYPGKEQIDYNQENMLELESVYSINSLNIFTWIQLIRKINKIKPDFVLLYWWTPFFFLFNRFISRFSKSEVICLCHNVLPHERAKIDKVLTKFALKKIKKFITHGEQEKSELLSIFNKLNENGICVNPHPSYDIQFKREELTCKEAKELLNLKGKVLLFFGFIRPYKGLKYLLFAMKKLLQKYSDIHLLVVGEFWGKKEDYIKIIENELDKEKIILVDYYIPDNQVGKYFQAADIVMIPYISATSSGIIQIAYGFKKPVISTDVGTLSEIVIDKQTGLIVPPRDSNALADAVINFYENTDLNAMIENIEKESYRFSWDRLVDIFESFKQN